MTLKKLSLCILIFLIYGCASVPMESSDTSELAKEFISPSGGKSGVYVFREDTHFGAALKKDVWIDGECIGETAKGIFFYHEVEGDAEHTISTESEFSPNDLVIFMENGMQYFIEQSIKFGVFVGGAALEEVAKDKGKKEIAELNMAKKGKCSEP